MLKVRGPDLGLLAIIDNYWNDNIHEGINREYVFSCTMVMDEKSEYVIEGNIVEVEGQYFNIVHYRSYRSGNGELLVQIDCEQVAYDLIDDPLVSFIHAGTPSAVLALLLAGTGFTIGTVEPTGIISVNVNEVSNKRAALIQLASLCGELKFNKYEISLYTQRGQNRGVQFRIGKNLAGIIKDVDRRSGTTQIAYDIDIIELNSLEEYAGLEYFELGDTVKIIDAEIGVNENQRIVEYDYSPKQRINSKVIIANFIDGIQDTITRIQTSTVVKDRLYYGTRIGPDNGFESIRSDNKARSIMNADMIKMQKGDGSGSSWTDSIYMDVDGNANFVGIITASAFIGGNIAIGSGNDIFKADATGIYLGHATFASAPFNVDMAGHMIAVGAEFSGEITASIITGGQIIGSTITGATIQTNATGNRLEMVSTGLNGYDSSGLKRVAVIKDYGGLAIPAFVLYDTLGIEAGSFRSNYAGRCDLVGVANSSLTLAASGAIINGNDVTVQTWGGLFYWGSDVVATRDWANDNKVSIGSSTSSHTQSSHNHGIPNGTVLMVNGGGTVTFSSSGGFTHSHTV